MPIICSEKLHHLVGGTQDLEAEAGSTWCLSHSRCDLGLLVIVTEAGVAWLSWASVFLICKMEMTVLSWHPPP